MRRFHVHISVDDLALSRAFYARLFGEPAVIKDDYVKWMLDDPPVNFAISARGHVTGVNHLGIQVDSEQELRAFQERLLAADPVMITEDKAACCYAESDKYWVTDPNGIAWETFHTLADIPTFGTSQWDAKLVEEKARDIGCCAPVTSEEASFTAVESTAGSCCKPFKQNVA